MRLLKESVLQIWRKAAVREEIAAAERAAKAIQDELDRLDQAFLFERSIENRLVQEVTRLGGHFAHVHDEAIDPKHDDAAGEPRLHGRFSYILYRRPPESR